MTIQYSC